MRFDFFREIEIIQKLNIPYRKLIFATGMFGRVMS